MASESKEEGDGDEGCEWDDWDAESDQDKPVESTAQTSSSLDGMCVGVNATGCAFVFAKSVRACNLFADPAVAEVSAFLKELRASCVAAAACLGLPEGDNPFQHVLAKLLSPSDAFVIHWLLRHENVM